MSNQLSGYMIVRSQSSHFTSEYMAFNRVALLHIISAEVKKTYCGRSADGWDMPYPGQFPTLEEILKDDKSYCHICQRAVKSKHLEET